MSECIGLLDSHFHSLSMTSRGMDARQAIHDFFALGGSGLLDVAVDVNAADFEVRRRLAEEFPRLWLSAGIHPSEAPSVTEASWTLLKHQLAQPKVIALGEIGLDWYRGREHRDEQIQVFRRQLELALERDLPVIIHNRDADIDLLSVLDEVPWTGRGIFHCFSSDLHMAEAGLERGFWISFAGNVTYPSAQKLREVARLVPQDRLLVETDSPYLSPQGKRGQLNMPMHAALTARCLAEARQTSVEDVMHLTRRNFENLMGVATH